MNKKNLILALILALIFSLPLTAFAFPGDMDATNGHSAKKLERLSQSLNLTAEQKSKMEPILKEQGEKFKAIREETRSRMQEFLSKEQILKMDEMKKQSHEAWQKKHGELTDSLEKPL